MLSYPRLLVVATLVLLLLLCSPRSSSSPAADTDSLATFPSSSSSSSTIITTTATDHETVINQDASGWGNTSSNNSSPTRLRGLGGGRRGLQEGDLTLFGPELWWESEGGELRVNGHPFHLKGVAWYGLETGHRTLLGLGHRSMDSLLDWLVSEGFNTLRLPFSLRMALHLDEPIRVIKDGQWWSTPRALMEMVIDKAAERGILVLLDMHRADDDEKWELWYTVAKYRSEDLKRGWHNILSTFNNKRKWNILGADLVNEPNGRATWGEGNLSTDWNKAAEDLALYLVNNCKDFTGFFFIQGVGGELNDHVSFWGGNLSGVRHAPIDLTFTEGNRRVVYSPHTYGPAVVEQKYFHHHDFPHNMVSIWDEFFGFVQEQTGRAVVMGEWGGPMAGRNEVFEVKLGQYLYDRCMSNQVYWCLNPGSADTGGLLRHDWFTPFKRRLALLRHVQPHPSRIRRSQDGRSYRFTPGAYANPACARRRRGRD